MTNAQRAIYGGILLALTTLSSGCIIAEPDRGYREGYYDREHNRYYHEHGWRDCSERDEHCR